MDEETPHIEVRAVHVNDAPALHQLDANFETDRIYTLRVRNHLMQENSDAGGENNLAFAFELVETPVDPPIYQDSHEYQKSLELIEAQLQRIGGYVCLAGGGGAGGGLFYVDAGHEGAHI